MAGHCFGLGLTLSRVHGFTRLVNNSWTFSVIKSANNRTSALVHLTIVKFNYHNRARIWTSVFWRRWRGARRRPRSPTQCRHRWGSRQGRSRSRSAEKLISEVHVQEEPVLCSRISWVGLVWYIGRVSWTVDMIWGTYNYRTIIKARPSIESCSWIDFSSVA